MEVNQSVLDRYSEGAKERQDSLCCPVDYDASLMTLLPQEVIDKDYGCGDPSRYVQDGDVVLDLGSGSGKICYMAAQLVGERGQVIGVDMNDDMLALARKYQPEMAGKLGNDRVRFVKGQIQDLALDLDALNQYLSEHPIRSFSDEERLAQWKAEQRTQLPLIADQSVDLVLSNCVLNLVSDAQKDQLVSEIFRVLKPGGRIAISDIVADEPIPELLKQDPELWSGCISGAFIEDEFLEAFKKIGFHGVRFDKWDAEPWQVVEGIEFRAVTVTAQKPLQGERLDAGHAVIYRGPYASIEDDQGRSYPRGQRIAVSDVMFKMLTEGPYGDDFIGIQPNGQQTATPACIAPGTLRPVAESKGASHRHSSSGGCC